MKNETKKKPSRSNLNKQKGMLKAFRILCPMCHVYINLFHQGVGIIVEKWMEIFQEPWAGETTPKLTMISRQNREAVYMKSQWL